MLYRLRGEVYVFLIRVRVSLPSSHNPYTRSLVAECGCKVLGQAHLIAIFSLLRETEAGERIRIDDSRKDTVLFRLESCAA